MRPPSFDDVGAVVVHYQSEVTVPHVVAAVVAQGVSPSNLILVDNGSSSPGLEPPLRELGIQVRILTLPNPGYAAAVNRGIEALPDDVRYVVVLTHEVILETEALHFLMETLLQNPEAAVAAPLLLELDDPGRVWSAGGTTTRWLELPRHKHHGAAAEDVRPGTSPADWTDGACFLVKRDVWKQIGGADEDYFLYLEDVDLGRRLRTAGYSLLVDARARAAQSPSGHIPQFLVTRNVILILRRHRRWLALLLWIAGSIGAALRDSFHDRGASDARWRGIRAGIQGSGGPPPGNRTQ